jgi:hypothetical protein
MLIAVFASVAASAFTQLDTATFTDVHFFWKEYFEASRASPEQVWINSAIHPAA